MIAGLGGARSAAGAPDNVANARQGVEHELQQALRDQLPDIAEQGELGSSAPDCCSCRPLLGVLDWIRG